VFLVSDPHPDTVSRNPNDVMMDMRPKEWGWLILWTEKGTAVQVETECTKAPLWEENMVKMSDKRLIWFQIWGWIP
jgi:hypothetical protein